MRARNSGDPENPVTNYGGITKFVTTDDIPTGRFTVSNGGIPIDFLHEYKGSETTIVCFHGAVKDSVVLPVFTGRRMVGDSQANLLAVSDPTLILSKSMSISWYAGSEYQNDLQAIIRRVIEVVMDRSKAKHLIFLGASGGGFAVLDMSRRFPQSLALPMNPQTSIANHREGPISRYMETAWPSSNQLSELPRRTKYDQISAYADTFENTVGFIQNARDLRHIKHHMTPFIAPLGEHENLWLLSESWGDPNGNAHVPPPRPRIAEIIDRAVASSGDWHAALRDLGFTQSPKAALSRWDISEVTW